LTTLQLTIKKRIRNIRTEIYWQWR